MQSTLELEWSNFYSQLTEAEQISVLHFLRGIIERRRQSDVPVDIEEYNREIDLALAEMEAGNYITHEEMQKRSAAW